MKYSLHSVSQLQISVIIQNIMDESQLLENTSQVRGEQAYKKIKVLGEGSMGKAYLVQSKSDHELYVMKRINIGHLSAQQKQSAMREAQLHSIVQHPNIIAFKEIYHTTKDKLCIIMEYAQNGDLDQFIQNQDGKFLAEDVVLNYFTQICLGLKEIHSKKIIHRDIKGANIFLSKDMTVKIGDFGISKVIDQTVQASKSFVGTPYYLSPQMVEGKPYSTKADIWALGVLLYNMCAQKLPFQANSLPLLALRILKGSFPPLSGPYSRELKGLILSMLQVDARKRPTVIDILNKPLLSKFIPQDEAQKLQALKQKPRISKNPTVASLSSPSMHPQSSNTVKPIKKSNKVKLSEEERKQKEKDLKQEKKKKRDEEIKEMRDDIRKKRLEAQKDKLGSTKMLGDTQPIIPSSKVSKKVIQIEKSPNKGKSEQLPVEKPWKTAKTKGLIKKDVQFQILVPSVKPRQPKKQPQIPPQIDFKIEIKQYGKKPVSTPDILTSAKQSLQSTALKINIEETQNSHQNQNQSDNSYYESVEEDPHQYEESQQVDFEKMMNHLNRAQEVVKGLKGNPGKEIELYEESQNFDDNNEKDLKQLAKKPQTPQLPQMNTMQQHSWNFIQNSDNLEQCRQILEQGLGEQRFMKAYNILNEHLDLSEQKKLRGQELEDYTFNRQVLRKKLEFLTDREFSDYVVLMYTLIVIELEEMKKNLEDD